MRDLEKERERKREKKEKEEKKRQKEEKKRQKAEIFKVSSLSLKMKMKEEDEKENWVGLYFTIFSLSRHTRQPFYSMILATTPVPTVLPPSRMVKRSPCSMGILAIISTDTTAFSPGMTISLPSSRLRVAVMSQVRK